MNDISPSETKKLPLLRPGHSKNLTITLAKPSFSSTNKLNPRNLSRPKSRNEHQTTPGGITEQKGTFTDCWNTPNYNNLNTWKTIDNTKLDRIEIPNKIPSKISSKENGCVMGYAANTTPGLFR